MKRIIWFLVAFALNINVAPAAPKAYKAFNWIFSDAERQCYRVDREEGLLPLPDLLSIPKCSVLKEDSLGMLAVKCTGEIKGTFLYFTDAMAHRICEKL